MSIKNDLVSIVGPDSVLDDEKSLAACAADQSFVSPRRPDLIVFAETVGQVQAVVRYANTIRMPLVPFSSGLNLHGAAVPRQGGIILNLTKMNAPPVIDIQNWSCVIEPGTTAAELQDALAPQGLRALLPWGIHPRRSALSSYLERDPAVAAANFEFGNELIMDTELVLPTGELFRTGLWAAGGNPGSPMGPVRAMLNRLWTGSQGTLGILTKMNIKVEHLPRKRELCMYQFDSFSELQAPLRRIQRKEIGLECFVLNSFNAAALLCRDWIIPDEFPAQAVPSREFETLREKLPAWLLIVCLNGGPRQPEGKIAYELEALAEISASEHLQAYGDGRLKALLLAEVLRPWGALKKFCYRGSVHDVSFKTVLKRVPDFQRILQSVTNRHEYPLQDVGTYVLPLERGRAVHVEFDLHCDRSDPARTAQVRSLWLELSERFIDEGAFFDRPYGPWADMVYRRAGAYTQRLKQIKQELDPNDILNPGQLCF